MSIKIRSNLNRLRSKAKSKEQNDTMYSLQMWQSHLAALAKVSKTEGDIPSLSSQENQSEMLRERSSSSFESSRRAD